MAEIKGFAGTNLFVDLSGGRIEKRPLDSQDAKDYIGAAGINAKLAFELIEPGIDALGPKNVLIFGIGPFAATTVPGAARTVASAKSPMTGYYATSAAGHFGTMLKLAGYDHLIITGKSDKPVYLRIFDDEVTIEDASHLWGKDVYETTDALWEKYPEAWVNCIGPGGENMVAYAVIIQNRYSTYGSTGLGAVMGSKKLKAIVVQGTKRIEVANPAGFLKLVDKLNREVRQAPYLHQWRELGTLIQAQPYAGPGHADRGNQSQTAKWTEIYSTKVWRREGACPSCPLGCRAVLEMKEGTYKGSEFTISCPAGSLTAPFISFLGLPLEEYYEAVRCSELANRYGISSIGAADMIKWAIDFFAEGILTKKDTGGLELRKGDARIVHRLLHDIAFRKGLGDILASRGDEAIHKIGRQAESYVLRKGYIIGKKGSSIGDIYRRREKGWTVLGFGTIVDPRAASYNVAPANAYSSITWLPGRSGEALRRYAERIGVPENKVRTVVTGETDGFKTAGLTRAVELYNLVLYSVSSCQRPPISRVLDIDTLATLYTAATGIEVTGHDLLTGAERILTLQRLFNVREGLTRDNERFPDGYLSAEADSELSGLLDEYYESHGWEKDTGIPKQETLVKLGLPYPVALPPPQARE